MTIKVKLKLVHFILKKFFFTNKKTFIYSTIMKNKIKFLVTYFIILLIFLNCQGLMKQKNIQVIKIDEINITPSPVKKEISYAELIKMDKNQDGIINQFENPTNFSFNTLQEVLSAYAEYLNQYQEYDYLYGIYLDKDINKNNKIDDFEKQISELKIKGKKDKCIEILKKKKESEHISKYQFYSAMYSLYNYMGDGKMVEKISRDMSYKFQLSNFYIFLRLNIPKLHRFWHKYNYSDKDPRYLLSAILSKGLLMSMHNKDDSISRIKKNRNILFPYLFIDKTFMTKFISKIQVDLYAKNDQLKIKLESIKNKKKR